MVLRDPWDNIEQKKIKKNGNILCTERKGVVDGWEIVSSGWEYAENHNKSKTHALFTTLSLKEEKKRRAS